MGQIFDAVTRFLTADGWPIKQIGSDPAYSMTCAGEHGEWTCVAQAVEDQNLFVFYSACPVQAPPETRLRVAELMARINFDQLIGNFEMDFEDGHIRCRTSIDITGHDLKPFMVSQVVYNNVRLMDRYLPAFEKLIADPDLPPVLAQIQAE